MKNILILILIVLPVCGVAQDFFVHALDGDDKELRDTLASIPPVIKVKIKSTNPSKKFRFQKAEVILSRQKARVATMNLLSSIFDLGMFYNQSRPGDHLVISVFIEESEGENLVKTHTKVLDYFLTGKK